MLQVCGTLIESGRNFKGKAEQCHDAAILNVLWDLKDRVVTLNKCLSILQFNFEKAAFLGELNADEARELLALTLKFLSINGSRPILEELQNRNPAILALVREVYLKTHTRSNWLQMTRLPTDLRPSRGNLPLEHEMVQPCDVCCEFCRLMGVVADGVEGTLDYMFEGAIGTLTDQN
jgi:hypothetical protein